MRIASVRPPDEEGATEGLAWSLFLPERSPRGGVVVLHGADSRKESHHGFGRACREGGLAALCADLRGHGASDAPMDGRVVDDVVVLAEELRARLDAAGARDAPIALRGSSMGGYLAIVAAEAARATAVVAICPATQDGLRRGLESGRFDFPADVAAVTEVLESHAPLDAVTGFGDARRLLLLHAEADEQVPVEHSRALHAVAPGSRLVVAPGGHHRSVQHDAELEGVSVRFLVRALRGASPSR